MVKSKKMMPGKLPTILSILIALIFSISPVPPNLEYCVPVTGKPEAGLAYQSSPIKAKTGFINTVKNGKSTDLVGIWLPNLTGLTIINQPSDQPGFVSEEPLTMTRFHLADHFGSLGLLAHAHFAGSYLQHLETGQVISLIYGDGSVSDYSIVGIRNYQASDPRNEHTSFTSMDDPSIILSQEDLFREIYAPPGRLILQTCIIKQDETRWGRKFIIAEKIN